MKHMLRYFSIALAVFSCSALASGFSSGFASKIPSEFSSEMAVTVDDLPRTANAPNGLTRLEIARQMIAVLKKHHVPQPFGFVNAERLMAHPEETQVLKEWVQAGFPLGNHTYSHADLNSVPVGAYERNIEKNEKALTELMGDGNFRFFRYPFLHEGTTLKARNSVRSFLRSKNYEIAEVSVDFNDWIWNDPYARCREISNETAILSLRESYLNTAKEYFLLAQSEAKLLLGRDIKHVLLLHIGAFDAAMLDRLLTMYEGLGVHFIKLQDALTDPIYDQDSGYLAESGDTILDQWMILKKIKFPGHKPKPIKEVERQCL